VLVPHRAIAALGAWLVAMEGRLRTAAATARIPGWAEPIVEPVVRRVRAHPLGRRINAQFLQFGFVGAFGFFVDYAALLVLTELVQFNPILGKVLSFGVAVIATWIVNRTWTFREEARDDRRMEEASSYLAVQCAAFALNFAVFAALIRAFPGFDHGLALFPPMAAGSIAGLGVNYFGSRQLVFRPRPTPAE
jgi:putative flippase GtrA